MNARSKTRGGFGELPRGRTGRLAHPGPQKALVRMDSIEPFFRQTKKDGAIDSICTRCYMTVGTARHESELPEIEHSHTCDPYWLLRWQQQSA